MFIYSLIQKWVFIWFFCVTKIFCLDTITIGAFSHETSPEAKIPLRILNFETSSFRIHDNVYNGTVIHISEMDIVQAQKTVCDVLKSSNDLAAIFAAKTSLTSPIVESICSYLHIPYIITSWRETFYNNPNNSLNFYPDSYLFSKALAEIVKSLSWVGYYILYENEESLIRLQQIMKLQNFKKEINAGSYVGVRQFHKGLDQRTLLKSVGNATAQIIVDCKVEKIIPLLHQARELNMLSEYYSYFFTSLEAHTIDLSEFNIKANITSIRLFKADSPDLQRTIGYWKKQHQDWYGRTLEMPYNQIKTETALYYDALNVLRDAIKAIKYRDGQISSTSEISCEESNQFESGYPIIEKMKNLTQNSITGLTGPIKFDENGNRIDFTIYIYNHRNQSLIGTWYQNSLELNLSRTSEEVAIVSLKENIIKVATRFGEPYLMKVPGETGQNAYRGYVKDLMDSISYYLGFQYEFVPTADNGYGNWDKDKKMWTGVVGDVLYKRAHMATCDLTATYERRRVVEFSQQFMTLGITILHKTPDKQDEKLFAFLEPFESTVWMYTATLYLVVSIITYFVARMNPGDWENPHPCDENPEELENMWGVKNAHWVTLGAIMNQGCDILPKGISSRMAVAMWWFFALIITNSYMANLTAFLTKANMESEIKNVIDLAQQTKVKFGALKDGSSESFFKNSNESLYLKMYDKMKSEPSVAADSNEDGVKRVLSNKKALYAFLMESSNVEYETSKNCTLKQIGAWLDIKNYAIAMPINAPYRHKINQAILHLNENGTLELLKARWWKRNDDCDKGGDDGATKPLTFENLRGIFFVLGVGVGLSCILGVADFLWNVRNISVEEHISYWEVLKMEIKFAANIWIKKKKIKAAESKSSSNSSIKTENRSIFQHILHSATSLVNLNPNTNV